MRATAIMMFLLFLVIPSPSSAESDLWLGTYSGIGDGIIDKIVITKAAGTPYKIQATIKGYSKNERLKMLGSADSFLPIVGKTHGKLIVSLNLKSTKYLLELFPLDSMIKYSTGYRKLGFTYYDSASKYYFCGNLEKFNK